MALTAREVAEKHARRLSGAVDDIRKGVEGVTESPTEKAAAAADKMLARLQAKVLDGTWARRLRSVSLGDWKAAMLEKGVGRIAVGVQAAIPKTTEFYAQLLPFEQSLKTTIDAMPDVTLEDSIARSSAWIRGMAEFSKD